MKKLLLLLLIFTCFDAFAQVQVQTSKAFTIGGELDIPNYGIYNVGTGASLKFELPVASHVSLSITGGFTSVFYRGTIFTGYSSSGGDLFVPVKAGLRYFFVQNVYAEGEGGATFELNHTNRTLAAFSIGPGFILPAGKNSVDLGFRYEDWQGQLKLTVLRVAYRW